MGAMTVWSTARRIDDGVGQDEDDEDELECVQNYDQNCLPHSSHIYWT